MNAMMYLIYSENRDPLNELVEVASQGSVSTILTHFSKTPYIGFLLLYTEVEHESLFLALGSIRVELCF